MYELTIIQLARPQQVAGKCSHYMARRPNAAPHAAMRKPSPQMGGQGVSPVGMVGIRQIMDPDK